MKPIYLVLIASLLAGDFAQAQPPTQTQMPTQTQTPQQRRAAAKAIASACKTDIQQLCSGKTGQAAQQCLQSNESKLSSECKSAMSANAPPKG
jgi:hypothetical protein